jgi:hypothetical protein
MSRQASDAQNDPTCATTSRDLIARLRLSKRDKIMSLLGNPVLEANVSNVLGRSSRSVRSDDCEKLNGDWCRLVR